MTTDPADKVADKVRWGYLIAFFLLLISYILTYYSTREVAKQESWVNHTTDVINTLDDLLSEIKDGDLSFSGYLILKNPVFINEYYRVPHLTDSILSRIRLITNDNILQQKRLDTLNSLIRAKFNLMQEGIVKFKNNNYYISDSLTAIEYRGKQQMNEVRYMVIKMQAEENNLIVKRSGRVTNISDFIKVINIASFVIAIVLVFYTITTFNKENVARKQADKKAADFRNELEIKINEKDKLNTELVELKSIEKFAVTGRIARTIAHEVRNPLTNINLAAEHLHSEVTPSAETELLFGMITRNSNRINELISDLLNSTKAAQLNFQKVLINDMLDASLQFAQDRIELKQIKVIKNYAEELHAILADVEKINIAFLNIIVNAIEAMESNGTLILKTENKNKRCVVTITDSGKGMNKESLSRLFEAYFTTKEKGTGLGLTNTQNIILGHDANISAESQEGKGSSFIISFNYA